MLEEIREKRKDILDVAAKYGAGNIRIFGSVAKGLARPDSDVDVLVDFYREHTLLDRIRLIYELESLLGRKVDVVTEKTLHKSIRERVIKEAIPL